MTPTDRDDELRRLIAWFDERDAEAEAWLREMADRIFVSESLEPLWLRVEKARSSHSQ